MYKVEDLEIDFLKITGFSIGLGKFPGAPRYTQTPIWRLLLYCQESVFLEIDEGDFAL